MADPQPYQISYSFAGFQANNPSTPLPAQVLDIELLNIQEAISGLVTSVTNVRRSDGALKNQIVTLDALHPSIRTAALSPVSNWGAATAYGAGQVVIQDGSLWSAVEAHTSGDDFDTDEGDGLWTELAELPPGPQGPSGTLSVGAVATGAAGTDVIIANVGTPQAAVLNITIPRGDVGNTGPAAWAAPVAWQTATAYTATAPRSAVVQGGETYVCLVSHTSGTFSTDLSNGNWIKVAAKGTDGLGTGDVTTTGSVVTARLARYADTSGDVLEDAGVAVSTDGALASNSNAKVPTEQAVKTYADGIRTAILNGVSSAYDTLAEIATWIGTVGTAAFKNTGTSGNTVPLLDAANTWSLKQTFSEAFKLFGALEALEISASAPAATSNINQKTASVRYFTSNAANNWTTNVRGDVSTTLNSRMAIGEAVTVAMLTTQSGTAYYQTAMQIDGNAVTPKWIGGAPSAGTVNSLEMYVFTIIKTADATFTVLAQKIAFT